MALQNPASISFNPPNQFLEAFSQIPELLVSIAKSICSRLDEESRKSSLLDPIGVEESKLVGIQSLDEAKRVVASDYTSLLIQCHTLVAIHKEIKSFLKKELSGYSGVQENEECDINKSDVSTCNDEVERDLGGFDEDEHDSFLAESRVRSKLQQSTMTVTDSEAKGESVTRGDRRMLRIRSRNSAYISALDTLTKGWGHYSKVGFYTDEVFTWLYPTARILRCVLSYYNRRVRLRYRTYCPPTGAFESDNVPFLHTLGLHFPRSLLPCPTPSEYVDERYVWSRFGQYSKKANEQLGHGYFYRPRPVEELSPITNMATSAMTDYDMVEDGFVYLKKASVICADYELLKKDFPEALRDMNTHEEMDMWLLENAAYISEGQLKRISEGGDHHELLGFRSNEEVQEVIDVKRRKWGFRARSGGRAAAFTIGDACLYATKAELTPHSKSLVGRCVSPMLDVKGLGTHKDAAYGENKKNTGLLNLADALRELAMQRLIERIAQLEGEDWSTVKFYALIDTALAYPNHQVNPSTGWKGEKCVLAVRQCHSRAFVHYDGYNFSGNLLMSGEDFPSKSISHGTGKQIRQALLKYGITAEMLPQFIFSFHDELACMKSLQDISGMWNLQCDASLTHFMDFSDYYVMPFSPLRAYRMSKDALRDALTLERLQYASKLFQSKSLMEYLYGFSDRDKCEKEMEQRREMLAQDPVIRDACCTVKDVTEIGYDQISECSERGEKKIVGLLDRYRQKVSICGKTIRYTVERGPPKYCMCWFMELDDSLVSVWAKGHDALSANEKKESRGEVKSYRGDKDPSEAKQMDLLSFIDSWLPK